MEPLIFAADVGGTKTDLGLFRAGPGGVAPLRTTTFPTVDAPSLAALASGFLGGDGARVAVAALGVAGPVRDGRAFSPNLPWQIDAAEISSALGIENVVLLNDLAATAWGLDVLPPEAVFTLQEGKADPTAPRALIAPGTGLGEALLLNCGGLPVVVPTEGGHVDFAPADDEQVALYRHLAHRYGHVSWERVVSGQGLRNIHGFLLSAGCARPDARLEARMGAEDAAAVIADEALRGADSGCAAALDLFVRAYGAEAGNLALKSLATGGVCLCGGITPKILPKLREGAFLEAFRDKGRLSVVLRDIPVHAVLEPRTALIGAARYGSTLLAPSMQSCDRIGP